MQQISRATGKVGLCVAAPQEEKFLNQTPTWRGCLDVMVKSPLMEAATNTQITHLVHVDNPIPTDKNNGDLIYPSQWEKSIGGACTTIHTASTQKKLEKKVSQKNVAKSSAP